MQCKANEQVCFENTDTVTNSFTELGIVPMLSDETKKNPISSAIKEAYKHPTIPFYLVIPPTGPVVTLDAVVTPKDILEALAEAGISAGG